MILDLAVEDGLIPTNPAEKVRRPKIEKYKPHPLRPDELARVEAALHDPQCRFAFHVFSRLGIRFCELRQLKWKDVLMQERRLRIEDSKTPEGERWLAIPQRLAEAFKEHYARTRYRHETNYVFCHPQRGSQWHTRYFRRAMKEALEAAGIEGRFRPAHDLRVSSITNGVLVGEHPSKLMQRAGHTNYDTTRGYIQLAGEMFLDDADALEDHLVGAAGVSQETTQALD
jgi:integrase/recombinase XerD